MGRCSRMVQHLMPLAVPLLMRRKRQRVKRQRSNVQVSDSNTKLVVTATYNRNGLLSGDGHGDLGWTAARSARRAGWRGVRVTARARARAGAGAELKQRQSQSLSLSLS
jgi:hypothetical protein